MATNYNFAESSFHELIKGVTFPGRSFELLSNSVAVDLTDANIDIWFRFGNVKGKPILKINETDGITITDATAGKFQIDSFLMDWNEGTYYYDVMITLSTGVVKKYIWGTLPIKEDSTNE